MQHRTCSSSLLSVCLHVSQRLRWGQIDFYSTLLLLLTKCSLTIHSCKSTHSTLPILTASFLCVCSIGCGCRAPCEGGNGSSVGARHGPHTHKHIQHTFVCVGVRMCALGIHWGTLQEAWTTVKYFITSIIQQLQRVNREIGGGWVPGSEGGDWSRCVYLKMLWHEHDLYISYINWLKECDGADDFWYVYMFFYWEYKQNGR